MNLYEFVVQDVTGVARLALQDLLCKAFKKRNVAIDTYLKKKVRKLCAGAGKRAEDLLPMFEPLQSALRKRVDVDDSTAVAFRCQTAGQLSRMLGPGIVPNDKDRLRLQEV